MHYTWYQWLMYLLPSFQMDVLRFACHLFPFVFGYNNTAVVLFLTLVARSNVCHISYVTGWHDTFSFLILIFLFSSDLLFVFRIFFHRLGLCRILCVMPVLSDRYTRPSEVC